jgi:large subunit ribosomal protein L3
LPRPGGSKTRPTQVSVVQAELSKMAKVAGILGKKVGMTQLFDSRGDVRPATVLQAGPCVVTQHKTATRDGYSAAQLGLVEFLKESKLTKPMRGHLGKNNLPPVRFVREVPIEAEEKAEAGSDVVKAGERVLVDIFDGEKFVDIVGVSKGRGFQGVVKRHHFAGGPKSHGSMFQITGSIGSSAFPSRVFKGMRMSGHMGNARITMRNARVLGLDKEDNLLVVEGGVPGPNGGYVIITKAKKPPRERRGFAGAATVDPLKAAKRAAKKA